MNRTEKNIQNFKAIELIKTFSILEVKRFGRFLQSPYHNNNQDLIVLFDFLRPLYPAFGQAKLNRPKIWKALFKTKPFQAIKFKKIFSELNLLAEEFIVFENLKSNKREEQKQLIAALKPRHFKRFVKESEILIKEIKAKKAYQSQDDFLDLHLLYQDLWHHIEWEKHQVSQKELLAAHEALVTYLDFNKVRTISEIETRKKFLNLNSFNYPDTLKNITEKNITEKNIPLSLFNNFLKFERNPTWDAYLILKQLIIENYQLLDKEIIQDGITHLNNYLMSQLSKDKLGLETEIFDLLKWAADNRIFINNGSIYENLFSTTIIFAIKNKQIAWAETYLKNNEQYLKSANKYLVLGYLKAGLAYTEHKFEEVIISLITLQPSHQIQYYFFFKSLITRAYFELILKERYEYQESLLNELNAFEKGVRRNRKFSKARKENYLNYIKILRQLSAILFLKENRKTRLLNLEIKAKKLNHLDKRQWLIEKIEFLQKKIAVTKI